MIHDHQEVACGRENDPALARYKELLDGEILPRLERPGRHIGPFDARRIALSPASTTQIVLLWPSVPESHSTPQALLPLQHSLQRRLGAWVEIACALTPDLSRELHSRSMPPFSRPSWSPLPRFPLWVAYLEHPIEMLGLLDLMKHAGLPLLTEGRSGAPRILAVGPAVDHCRAALSVCADALLPSSDAEAIADRIKAALAHLGSESEKDAVEAIEIQSTGAEPRLELLRSAPTSMTVHPILEAHLQSEFEQVETAFGGARVTRLSLWSASKALREALSLPAGESLATACGRALAQESCQLHLRMAVGLPGESDADRAALPRLLEQLVKVAPRGAKQLRLELSTFVPKPGTQNGLARVDAAQLQLERLLEEIKPLKIRSEGSGHQEARLAWMLGQADLEFFHALTAEPPQGWLASLEGSSGPATDPFTRDHSSTPEPMATGIESLAPIPPTLDECGQPIQARAERASKAGGDAKRDPDRWRRWRSLVPREFQLRLEFAKRGTMRHLGHRELVDLFVDCCERAGLPLAASGIVAPRPKLSFGPSLPVGVEGLREFVDLSLTRKLPGVAPMLNEQLPEGLNVREALYLPHAGGKYSPAPLARAEYEARIDCGTAADPQATISAVESSVRAFSAAASHTIKRVKARESLTIDLKTQVTDLQMHSEGEQCGLLRFGLDLTSDGSRARPDEVLGALLSSTDLDVRQFTVRRTRLLARGPSPMERFHTPMELVGLAQRRLRDAAKRCA